MHEVCLEAAGQISEPKVHWLASHQLRPIPNYIHILTKVRQDL